MCPSLASCAGIPIVLLLLAIPASPLVAQSSAHQMVTVAVSPIVSLAVQGGSETAQIAEQRDGDATISLRYDLTTNVRGAVLEAALLSSITSDIALRVEAETTHGISEGAVLLRSGEPAVPIVADIQPGLENGQTISVSITGEARTDLILAVTLRDPASGVSTTVGTGL